MGSNQFLVTFRAIFSLFKQVIIKTIKVCRLNQWIYKFTRGETINFDRKLVETARLELEQFSADPKTSCRCNNKLEPNVDIHIIIPAYNVENYIKACLDSIVLKPTDKYSFLATVINDGSTDHTTEILKKYQNHSYVEIITQANKGFSGARNTGLSFIRGKYICFVDSDDIMDWRGVEKMMDAALETGADIIRGSHTTISDTGVKTGFRKMKTGALAISDLGGHPWAKLFKAELFSNVCFPEKYWYEDSIFAQIVFPRISMAYGVSENTYYYRDRISGITNQGVKKPKSIDSYWITERLFNERLEYGLELSQDYYKYILKMVKLTFSRIRLQPYEVKKNVFILFCDFIDKYFSAFHTDDKQYAEMERIIRSRDLGKCIAFAKWY